jgi:LacI family transcriptional regulator
MKTNRRATIDDVARMAGVSIKTVSRVTNHEPNVRESTREKVEAAIAKLNYRPNLSARSLASLRSQFIVLVYDDPGSYDNPSAGYFLRLQQGALRACRATNHELLIHPGPAKKYDLAAELQSLIERARPEGIILAAPLSNITSIVSAIAETETPFIQLSPGKESPNRYSVSTNDREISAEMTKYLASLGHKKIAFVAGNKNHKAVGNRLLGYQDGLRDSGLVFSDELVLSGDNSFASGEAAAHRLLGRKHRPTAIFAANDDMAAGVMRVAACMSINVPGELSVAGCDDISLASRMFPGLTTIRQPLAAMAERAALVLVEESGSKSPLRGSEVFPASLRIRESTGPAPE